MNDTQSTQHKLNEQQWLALCAVADQIVPPSSKYDVPGAGDRQICKQVIHDVGERLPKLIETLATLNAVARELGGNDLGELPEPTHEGIASAFREAYPRAADRLAMWVTQCYYRDDRVLASLGIDARPPFPKGYEVETGDWAELEPVVNRRPIFRDVT